MIVMIVDIPPQFQKFCLDSRLSNSAIFSISPSENAVLEGSVNMSVMHQVGTFSKGSDLPLRAYGELLREGFYPRYGKMSRKVLRDAFDSLVGKKLKFYSHHSAFWDQVSNSAKNILGWVYDFEWNEQVGAIYGKIELWDRDAALKFSQGLLDVRGEPNNMSVSVGFNFDKNYQTNEVIKMNIRECSFADEPVCPTARLKMMDAA